MLGASWQNAVSAEGEPLQDYMTMDDMIRNVRRISPSSCVSLAILAVLYRQDQQTPLNNDRWQAHFPQ